MKSYRMTEEEDNQKKLLTDNSPFAVVEAYRLARTNLMYTHTGDETPVYGVTSALPN